MSRQQHSQDTDNFGDSQMNPTQSWQNQQPGNHCTMSGDFGAAPAQQHYEPAVRPVDMWDENAARRQGPDYQNAASTGTGPTDVYASHAGQLGATGGKDQFDSTVGNTGTGRRFDTPGHNAQTYAGGPEPVPPPPAVPQPQAHAMQPSTSDKLMGNAEKLAGKISGNERLVERGQARKNGTYLELESGSVLGAG